MLLKVSKEFTFASAHCLPGYNGPCANLHGHEWKLEVEVIGHVDEKSGMVCDFVTLKKTVNLALIEKLDHHYLNDIFPFIPTAENMMEYFVVLLRGIFNKTTSDVVLNRVRLYETPTSFCEWSRTDNIPSLL